MEMNHLFLEYIWNAKKEEMKLKSAFKERFKLYSELTRTKRKMKK